MPETIVTVPPNEPYFTIVREFDAPRALVYKCYTEPKHMAHFWGPRDTRLIECKIDLRVGGVWKVRWQYPDGRGWGYASVYLDIVPNARIHYRDAPNDWVFGLDGLPPVDLLSTIGLEDRGRATIVTVTVRCTSVAARDDTVKSGFSNMVNIGHERLTEYLKSIDLTQV